METSSQAESALINVGEQQPIYNHDINDVEVILLDISCDKKYIAYVSHQKNRQGGHDMYDEENRRTFITRRKFTELDRAANSEQTAPPANDSATNDDGIEVSNNSNEEHHFTLEISQYLKKAGANHCKFLSISPNGKYVALSFYERNIAPGDKNIKPAENPYCLIFKVSKGSFNKFECGLKCKGRAVFLNKKSKGVTCLAIINPNTLKVYDNFPSRIKSNKISHWFDLRPLGSSSDYLHEDVVNQDSYIQNASWVNINGPDNEMNRLITYTRHIRHNVLTTPFTGVGNIVRVWSIIEDGVRLTSFPAPNQHVMAFSNDYKYSAAYIQGTRSVNIYNVKSGLLVYKLKSQQEGKRHNTHFEVSHIRFCYDARYLAMSGLETTKAENGGVALTKVVFEVWYIEAEQSIYLDGKPIIIEGVSTNHKLVQPFVTRGRTGKMKCLKGFYTTLDSETGTTITDFMELNIDQRSSSANNINDIIILDWSKNNIQPYYKESFEIENNLTEHQHLKCGNFIMPNGKQYFIRFGKHTVQLWSLKDPVCSDESVMISEEEEKLLNRISEDDKLLYIRAYKGPNYGLEYSFRETWKIHNFGSIKFVGGTPSGRMIVNITETPREGETNNKHTYHTEEIFLPFDQLESTLTNTASSSIDTRSNSPDAADVAEKIKFDYHQLESACQALHYLFTIDGSKEDFNKDSQYECNLNMIYKKTEKLIHLAIDKIIEKTERAEKIERRSNFFSTIAGSRTLAMLASFENGREIMKRIVVKEKIPISIFSYARSMKGTEPDEDEDEDEEDEDQQEDNEEEDTQRKKNKENTMERLWKVATCMSQASDDTRATYEISSTTSTEVEGVITYRSSPKIKNCPTVAPTIAANENVLTVLIGELSYDLYKLLFNRILYDSKELGPGCLSALTDALLFLQEEGNTDLLLESSNKLSYLEIKKEKLGILSSEISQVMKVKALQKEYISSLRDLESHATMEQIKKYSGFRDYLVYKAKKYFKYNSHSDTKKEKKEKNSKIRKAIRRFWRDRVRRPWRNMFKESAREAKKLSKVCVVPLPHFNSYSNFPEDRPKNYEEGDEVIPYKESSAFVQVASDQHSNNIFRQGDTVLEVLLEYKWKHFARWRFFVICVIHAIFYITYSTGVLFPREMYGFQPGESSLKDNDLHLTSIILMCAAASILFGQEFRQLMKSRSKLDYFSSGYNWVDILAFIFPLITLLQLLLNWDYLNEVSSICTLILWTHGILRLRAFMEFGITLETIIQLSKRIGFVLFIMLLVIFAFTNSFIVLLRLQDDAYFQENYNGTTDIISGPGSPSEGVTNIYDLSSDNGFQDVYKAFYQVWLFIYGVWDPITGGDAGDDKMIMAISILFSLITVLIFFNLVIALMSSAVEEVQQRGKKVWVSHFAAVVSEIELLWCLDGAKHSRRNNPTYIYYIANYDAVKRHEKELYEETERLKEKLYVTFGSDEKRCMCNK